MAYTIRDYSNDFFKAKPQTLNDVEDWVRSARVLDDGTVFNGQSFTLNNYADIESRFENLFKQLETLKDDEQRNDSFWFFCYSLCQQLILFYGSDKAGNEGYSKPDQLERHVKFAAKIKQYFQPCDVLSRPNLPDENTLLQQWPTKSDAAYIVANQKLYYVTKGAETVAINELAISSQELQQFEDSVKPKNVARTLSRKELQYIRTKIDIEHDNDSALKLLYNDVVGLMQIPTKVTAVKNKLGLMNLWRVNWVFCRLTMTSGLRYFRDMNIIDKFEDLMGSKFDEEEFIRRMEAPSYVINMLSVGLFAGRLLLNAAELIRHVCFPHGARCGLLKMKRDPSQMKFDDIDPLLKGRDAVILFNDELYYVDRKKREVQQIEIEARHQQRFEQLKLKFADGCDLVRMSEVPRIESFIEVIKNQYIIADEGLWYFDHTKNNLQKLEFLAEKSLSSLTDELRLSEKRDATQKELDLITSYTGHTIADVYKIADDKEQKLIISVTGRKPQGGEKDTRWTERLSFEISKRNAIYLNDGAWAFVNLFTNYPEILNVSAPLANWLVAGFLVFDFGVVLWQRFWAEKEYHRMRDHYTQEIEKYRADFTQVGVELAQLHREMNLLDDLRNSENYTAQADARMRKEISDKIAAKEEQQELLRQQIASDTKDSQENDLKWKAKNSTFWFNAIAAALFATGFAAALVFATPVVAIVAYASCMVAVAMYLSGNAYGNYKDKSLRFYGANRDYEGARKGHEGPGLQYIQSKNDSLREYQAARKEFWITIARNVIVPTLMLGLLAACWQAAVVFAALYVGYKLYQHYHKPSKTVIDLQVVPPKPAALAPANLLSQEAVAPREGELDVGSALMTA